MTTTGYKLYTFVNTTYSRPIQFGIQTAHLVHELVKKYILADGPGWAGHIAPAILEEWIQCPEPFIYVLDGRNHARLMDLQDLISVECEALRFPHGSFYESQDANGGALTVTGFVAPDDELIQRATPTVLASFSVDELFALSRDPDRALEACVQPYSHPETARHILSELLNKSSFAR